MADQGTPPDGWSFIPLAELGDDGQAVVRERVAAWKPEMAFARVTDLTGEFAVDGWPEGVWIEVWRVEPAVQAEFNPPLTAEKAV